MNMGMAALLTLLNVEKLTIIIRILLGKTVAMKHVKKSFMACWRLLVNLTIRLK